MFTITYSTYASVLKHFEPTGDDNIYKVYDDRDKTIEEIDIRNYQQEGFYNTVIFLNEKSNTIILQSQSRFDTRISFVSLDENAIVRQSAYFNLDSGYNTLLLYHVNEVGDILYLFYENDQIINSKDVLKLVAYGIDLKGNKVIGNISCSLDYFGSNRIFSEDGHLFTITSKDMRNILSVAEFDFEKKNVIKKIIDLKIKGNIHLLSVDGENCVIANSVGVYNDITEIESTNWVNGKLSWSYKVDSNIQNGYIKLSNCEVLENANIWLKQTVIKESDFKVIADSAVKGKPYTEDQIRKMDYKQSNLMINMQNGNVRNEKSDFGLQIHEVFNYNRKSYGVVSKAFCVIDKNGNIKKEVIKAGEELHVTRVSDNLLVIVVDGKKYRFNMGNESIFILDSKTK